MDERDQQRWLRLNDAAALAGVSRTALHYAAAAGKVPYAKVAGERFFAADDLLAWRDRRAANVGGGRPVVTAG